MKKKLVFHFYCDENYDNNRAVKIHLQCLKHYHNIFDEALFCIALDNIENEELISEVKKDILDCGFKNIIFKVIQNTSFREADTFYNEVITEEDSDSLIFFGHSKGYTNYYNPNNLKDSLDTWICGLYYLSLEDIGHMEYDLLQLNYCFYGSFLGKVINYNKYGVAYLGTFFWINKEIFLNNYKEKIPQKIDRYYAEIFAGELNDYYNVNGLSAYKYTIIYEIDLYKKCNNTIAFILGEEMSDFNKFKENIINKI